MGSFPIAVTTASSVNAFPHAERHWRGARGNPATPVRSAAAPLPPDDHHDIALQLEYTRHRGRPDAVGARAAYIQPPLRHRTSQRRTVSPAESSVSGGLTRLP